MWTAAGCWVWSTFYPYQWDLNYANPAVFAEMAQALLRLANRGIEVFRLDSTAFLWKRGAPTA
jgi:amylosucrase